MNADGYHGLDAHLDGIDAAADWTPGEIDDFPAWDTLDQFFEIVYQRRTALAEKETARYDAARAEWKAKESEMGKWCIDRAEVTE